MGIRKLGFKARRCRWSALAILAFASCTNTNTSNEALLTQVNLLDQNGFSEVITSKEKLKSLKEIDFEGALQPYQKVSRLYKKRGGLVTGVLTSYYPNGHIRQYLEIEGARAFGLYSEWYESGRKKIEGRLVGGKADLDLASEATWLFDGTTEAWDHRGNLQAQITYKSGLLHGLSSYYFSNGQINRLERFEEGVFEGKCLEFFDTGTLFKETSYVHGKKDGPAQIFLPSSKRIAAEMWINGRLDEGVYFSAEGAKTGNIRQGSGTATLVEPNGNYEERDFIAGALTAVRIFDNKDILQHAYHLENTERHGVEQFFYSDGKERMKIEWVRGRIEGEQKSWYQSGQLESLRLMEDNRRSGLSTAWYENGEVMLIEEYENDRLIEGKYFRSGEDIPISRVKNGSGLATLYNGKGSSVKRVSYEDGEPKLRE